jgi:hypothetical protein
VGLNVQVHDGPDYAPSVLRGIKGIAASKSELFSDAKGFALRFHARTMNDIAVSLTKLHIAYAIRLSGVSID